MAVGTMTELADQHRALRAELQSAIAGLQSLAEYGISLEADMARAHRETGQVAKGCHPMETYVFAIRDTCGSWLSQMGAQVARAQAAAEEEERLARSVAEAKRRNEELGYEFYTVPEADFFRTGLIAYEDAITLPDRRRE